MNTTLTRRSISAIAKLDMAALSHSQRIDAIAKALGFQTGAAMMATLKTQEAADPNALCMIIGCFGSEMTDAVYNNESIYDENGSIIGGDISEKTFNTPGEMNAYLQGVEDAEGWMEAYTVVDTNDDPNHPYFAMLKDMPTLSFAHWYESETRLDTLKDVAEEDGQNIIGYQVHNPKTGEHWNEKPSFLILDEDSARRDFIASLQASPSFVEYDIIAIYPDTIEEPTFE